MHAQGAGYAGQVEGGGGQVEQADHFLVDRAGLEAFGHGEVFGPLDDHGNVQARIVDPMNAPVVDPAVVPEHDDDGIVEELFLLEFLEDDSHAAVHVGDRIQVAGPLLVGGLVLGKVGRWDNGFRFGVLDVLLFAPPLDAFRPVGPEIVNVVLRFRGVHLQEEGLSFLDLFPVRALENFALVHEIQIELARAHHLLPDFFDRAREVTGILEPVGQRPDPLRQPEPVVPMVGEMVQVDGSLIHTRHESRSARGANRGGRENPVVADALGGQLIEVGRVNPLPAEAPEVQVAVVGDQPEDVGLVLGRANRGEDEQR